MALNFKSTTFEKVKQKGEKIIYEFLRNFRILKSYSFKEGQRDRQAMYNDFYDS